MEDAVRTGADVEQDGAGCEREDGNQAQAQLAAEDAGEVVGGSPAHGAEDGEGYKQGSGVKGALVPPSMADFAEVVIDPVKEDELEVADREIGRREEQEVAVPQQSAP